MSNSKSFELKRQKRIEDFLAKYKQEFIADFQYMTDRQLWEKYNLGESFYHTVRKYLGLERDKNAKSANFSALFAEKRKERIEAFMLEHGTEFTVDFSLLTEKELCEKYELSQSFFRTLYKSLGWSRQGLEQVKKDSYNRRAQTMRDVGNEKMVKTNLQRYGVKSALCKPEVQNKRNEAAKRAETIEKRQGTMLERYGVTCALHLDEARKKSAESTRKPEVKQKRAATLLAKKGSLCNFNYPKVQQTVRERYGVDNVGQIPESRKKASRTAHNAVSADGTRLDSSYEVLVWDYCKRNDIPIKRGPRVAFEYEGKEHYIFVDFEIDGKLFEIKGAHLLAGCFDYSMPVPIQKKLEVYRENLVTVITDKPNDWPKPESKDSNGHKYLSKCAAPLIGLDIELFKEPEFPFAKDKPKCFYTVQVSGQRSAYDAWFDERLRWKMILNRINYVGGFIDARAVLTAMNVTKTCKQPSWFSKSYAVSLIKEYITTDVIVDGFAGFGTRHDAAVSLGKTYYGCDLNEELVEWHKELNRSVEYGDACRWTLPLAAAHSVFICPPYQSTEVYIPAQDTAKTEEDWLDIMMQNFPNAVEYLMVCKTVNKYSDFIVEEKINKSHLGSNTEYVVLVRK